MAADDDFVNVSEQEQAATQKQKSPQKSSQKSRGSDTQKPEKTKLDDLPSGLISAYELEEILGQRYLTQRYGELHRAGPNAAIDRLTLTARQLPPGAWVLVLSGPLDLELPDQPETDENMNPPYQDPRPDPDIDPETIKQIQDENKQLAEQGATPEEQAEKGQEQNKKLQEEANPEPSQ